MQTAITEEYRTGALAPRVNVAPAERWVSGLLGVSLAVYGATRRSLPGALAAALGAALAYRGVTGHCHVYGALGVRTAGFGPYSAVRQLLDAPEYISDLASSGDIVQEASEESFPASDPPARHAFTSED